MNTFKNFEIQKKIYNNNKNHYTAKFYNIAWIDNLSLTEEFKNPAYKRY